MWGLVCGFRSLAASTVHVCSPAMSATLPCLQFCQWILGLSLSAWGAGLLAQQRCQVCHRGISFIPFLSANTKQEWMN